MKGFQLKNRRKFLRPPELLYDHVRSDFGGERKREPHKSVDTNNEGGPVNTAAADFAGVWVSLQNRIPS